MAGYDITHDFWHILSNLKAIIFLLILGGLTLLAGIYGAVQAAKGNSIELKRIIGSNNPTVCKVLAYAAIPIGLGVIIVAILCWMDISHI